jgi:threonine-phosphate decarboxylase
MKESIMTESLPLHGGQLRKIANHFGIPPAQLIDFSANINPDGPPKGVVPALRSALDALSSIVDYPDLDEISLRQALARYVGVGPENVAVSNGFVPLLEVLLGTLSIRSCAVPVPAFVEYRRTLERCRVSIRTQALSDSSGLRCDLDDLLKISCDAILLANPHNPSGVLLNREALLEFVQKAAEQNRHVLLDEAFIDYCPEDSLAGEVKRFPNLIVFRSVTKFFALAGLRVAYALASERLCKQMRMVVAPWSITTLASMAAEVALADEDYRDRTRQLNRERRELLQDAITRLGIRTFPSAANFLLMKISDLDSHQLWERMIRIHHIVLRNCANYESLSPGYFRAAVLTETENEKLIQALKTECHH